MIPAIRDRLLAVNASQLLWIDPFYVLGSERCRTVHADLGMQWSGNARFALVAQRACLTILRSFFPDHRHETPTQEPIEWHTWWADLLDRTFDELAATAGPASATEVFAWAVRNFLDRDAQLLGYDRLRAFRQVAGLDRFKKRSLLPELNSQIPEWLTHAIVSRLGHDPLRAAEARVRHALSLPASDFDLSVEAHKRVWSDQSEETTRPLEAKLLEVLRLERAHAICSVLSSMPRETMAESVLRLVDHVCDETDTTLPTVTSAAAVRRTPNIVLGGPESAWDVLTTHLAAGEAISAEVIGVTLGGVFVDVFGVFGFIPLRNLPLPGEPDAEDIPAALARLEGRRLKVLVIEADRSRQRLVLTART